MASKATGVTMTTLCAFGKYIVHSQAPFDQHSHEVEDPVSSSRNSVGRRTNVERRDLGRV